MVKIIFYILGISFCFLWGCNTKSVEMQLAEEMFEREHIEIPSSVEACMIIPEGGCGGCIASGISFLRRNATHFSCDQTKNMIVFTSVGSLKMLKRALRPLNIEDLNAILDMENKFHINEELGIYPLVIYFNHSKIVNVEIQSPFSENTLFNLEKRWTSVGE